MYSIKRLDILYLEFVCFMYQTVIDGKQRIKATHNKYYVIFSKYYTSLKKRICKLICLQYLESDTLVKEYLTNLLQSAYTCNSSIIPHVNHSLVQTLSLAEFYFTHQL